MTTALFTPRARRELRQAAVWIAEENPAAAENLLKAALEAARRITRNPGMARAEIRLAPSRYRVWSLRGYPFLLVVDTENDPSVVARFVHQARDLPVAVDDL
jgi:plasmid stabilization system protein ParE